MPDQTAAPPDPNTYRWDPAAAQEAMAQSDRMRGNTVSVRDRALQPDTFYAVSGRGWVTPQVRTRGTRRLAAGRPKAQSTRSSAKSGDSGSDDGPSDEPPKRRLCAFCNGELPPGKRKYCSDEHQVRDRVRRHRERQRERAKRTAAVRIPKLDRRDPMHTLEPWVREQLHDLQVCRCNGKHQEFDPGRCHRCGRQLPATHPEGDIRVRSFIARLVREAEERHEVEVAREHDQALARLGAVAS